MKPFLLRYKGFTLLEMILVLAIGGLILVLSLRQYQQLQSQGEVDKLKYEVDVLFDAMKNFYFAKCRSDPVFTNPNATLGFAGAPLALVTQGYLARWPLDSRSIWVADLSTWVVQFNRVVMSTPSSNGKMNVYACVETGSGQSCGTPEALNDAIKVIRWKMQVAVKPADSTVAALSALKALTGATCISTRTGGSVTPCGNSPANVGDYLVWERTVSALTTAEEASSYWLSTPRLNQFNMQYEHDQMYELMNGANNASLAPNYNYYCGG